jgi:Ion channel
MKKETATPTDRLRVLLKMYALALLLAMFISALHAGILFSIGDFNELLVHLAGPTLGQGRPMDILVVLATIFGLFVAHIAEASMWATFFWKSGHLASFSESWYFAGTSNTALGYGDVVLQQPWKSLGPICAINGLINFGCSTAVLFVVLQMVWHHKLYAVV